MAKFIEQIKMKKLAKIIAGVTLGAVALGTMSTTPVYAAEGMITGGTLNTDTKEYIGDAQKHAVVIDSSSGTALAKDMKIYGIKNTTGGTITGSVRADNFDSPSVTGLEIWGGWSKVTEVTGVNGINNNVIWYDSAKVKNIKTITGFYASANGVSATGTTVTLNSATVADDGKVYGTHITATKEATATGTQVTLTNANIVFQGEVYGAKVKSTDDDATATGGGATATGTTLTLTGTTIGANSTFWGAHVEGKTSAAATGTTVNMTGGSVDGDFYGVEVGVTDKGVAEATDTTLTINGATLKYKSKGAYVKGPNSATAMAINTKVTMTGGELHNSFNAAEVQANEAGSIGQANNTTLIIDNTRLTISEEDGITGAHVTANAGGEILSAIGTTVKLLNLTSTDKVGKELTGVQISGDAGFLGKQVASATADTTEVEMNGGRVQNVVGARFYHTKSAVAKVTTVTLNKVEADTVIGVNVTEDKDHPSAIAENATANDTTVTVTEAKVSGEIIGVNVAAVNSGVEAKKVTANNTKLTLNDTTVGGDVAGVSANATDSITAENTQVIFKDAASTVTGDVAGVNAKATNTITATDTQVIFEGAASTVKGTVYGVLLKAQKQATADGVDLQIKDGPAIVGNVFGAALEPASPPPTMGTSAVANNIKVTLNNAEIKNGTGENDPHSVFGVSVKNMGTSEIKNTNVDVTKSTIGDTLYGVFQHNDAGADGPFAEKLVTNNTTLSLNGATVGGGVHGVDSENIKVIEANGTKITLKDKPSNADNVYGVLLKAKTQATTESTEVDITGGKISSVKGTYIEVSDVETQEVSVSGKATGTKVTLNGVESISVYGDEIIAKKEAMSDGTVVEVTGGKVGNGEKTGVYGAHLTASTGANDEATATAKNTTVTIKNITGITPEAVGAVVRAAKKATADTTTVEVTGGTYGTLVGGAQIIAQGTDGEAVAKNTKVILTDVTAGGDMAGGLVISGEKSVDVNNTELNITGGTINAGIFAGVMVQEISSKEMTVNDTKITLNGIESEKDFYGVASMSTKTSATPIKATNTEIIFEGDVNEIKGIVWGTGQLKPLGANFDASNTSLTVKNSGNKVGNIANFHNLNFYIKEGITYGDTMVNITGSANTNIAGAKVGAIVEAKPKDNGDDKTINLLKNTSSGTITWTDTPKEGENYTIVVKEGAKLTLENTKNGVALSEDGTALVLTLGGIEESNDPEPGPKEIKPTSAATALFEDIVKNSDKMPESINKFWQSAVSSVDSSSVENFQAAVSGAFQASEITGTTSTAVSVTNNVSNLTFSRMSLVDAGSSANGGKGVGLMAPDSGAGVWARYVHGKDKADGMKMDGGSAEYSNNYNGVLVGADFKKVGKFQSGIFFSYVKGSGSNSFKDIMGATARYGHTDFHTYNFGYYGSVKNDDTNTMFDLSYGTTSSDSDTNGVGGAQSFSSKSKIFNAGVTAEKSFDVSGMKLVPYTGLRYMHVDGGEYTDSLGINHKADKQNVFMLPVGFKLSKENKLSHDWTLTPKLDLSYTWNMGDTDSEMTVSVPGLTASNLSYRVMDKGSFMGVAGIEAQHKNCTYGVSYAYQKGSHQDSKKIIADIKWTF